MGKDSLNFDDKFHLKSKADKSFIVYMSRRDLFFDTWMLLSFSRLPIIFIDNELRTNWYGAKILAIKFIKILHHGSIIMHNSDKKISCYLVCMGKLWMKSAFLVFIKFIQFILLGRISTNLISASVDFN